MLHGRLQNKWGWVQNKTNRDEFRIKQNKANHNPNP